MPELRWGCTLLLGTQGPEPSGLSRAAQRRLAATLVGVTQGLPQHHFPRRAEPPLRGPGDDARPPVPTAPVTERIPWGMRRSVCLAVAAHMFFGAAGPAAGRRTPQCIRTGQRARWCQVALHPGPIGVSVARRARGSAPMGPERRCPPEGGR